MKRLGDILVAKGAITRERLEELAARATVRLGEYVIAHTDIGARALAMALAEHHGLPYVELDETPPDASLFHGHAIAHYAAHRYVPFALEHDTLMIATSSPSDLLAARIAQQTGQKVAMIVTSPRDLTKYLMTEGARAITRQAQTGAHRKHRGLSAHRVILPHQSRGLLLLMGLLAIAIAIAPHSSWYALLVVGNLFYLTTLVFKLQLYWYGQRAQRNQVALRARIDATANAYEPSALPIYTILVPMYHESAAVIERLTQHLLALDYPREKLDIKLVVEADDTETIQAIESLKPPEIMQILRVPPSQPRTKPKACNVALPHVRGEYLVIFDAEDAPEPNQLKRAIALFELSDPKVTCVQAPLNYYNRNETLLTRLFAIEYSCLFRLLLPALEALELPIPLGGTSNHLKVARVHDMGGWDAYNVTEDADLGIRIAYLGERTRMLPSLTLEEAPITLGAWMKQRTRWIKGYIQTWLVFMRMPGELKQHLGRRGYYGFQLFVGAPALTFLLAPVFWAICLMASLGLLPTPFSPTLLGLCMVSFMGGILSHWLFARQVIALERWSDMRLALLVFPLYWLLHSLACARALWQLITAPHYWEKTKHGVSRVLGTEVRSK